MNSRPQPVARRRHEPAARPVQAPPGIWVGPYEVLARIGEGGMGVVHLARKPDGPRLALKVLRPHVVGDDEARARLAREVNALRRVTSPRVAEILDADPWADVPYVATRYVPGLSLHDYVRAEGTIGGEDLRWFALCLAEAIIAVHEADVLHRDIKPSNVVMEGRSPVLIDFGLARLQDDPRFTQTGWLMGTPGYVPPEVLYGGEATAASDVHSWAATVAFAALGCSPFGDGATMVVCDRVRNGEFSLDGVPAQLRPILAAALAPELDQRPTLAEIQHWLETDRALALVASDQDADSSLPLPSSEPLVTMPMAAVPALEDELFTAMFEPPGTAVLESASEDPTSVLPVVHPAPTRKVTQVLPGVGSTSTPYPGRMVEPVPLPAPAPAPLATQPSAPSSAPPPVAAAVAPAVAFSPPAHAVQPGSTYPPFAPSPGSTQPAMAPSMNPAPAWSPNAVSPRRSSREIRLHRWRQGALHIALIVAAGTLMGVAPYVATAAIFSVTWVVRAAHKSNLQLQQRQHLRGYKWYDTTGQIAGFPWQLVRCLPATVVSVVVAGGVGTMVAAGARLTFFGTAEAVLFGGLVTAFLLWLGAFNRGLRTPITHVTIRLSRQPVTWAVTLLVVSAVALGLLAVLGTAGPTWAPQPVPPWEGTAL